MSVCVCVMGREQSLQHSGEKNTKLTYSIAGG